MKPKSIVYLLSGSAPMVIKEVHDDEAVCVWFANGDSKQATFPLAILTKTASSTKPLKGYKKDSL